jgi:SNF2 family DNA or RNA helicase
MVCDKNKDGSLRPNRKKVSEIAKRLQGLVLDESSEVKGHNSLIFRICRKLSKTAFMVLALTGTPLGRDPTDLWAQMYLVDKGETLGETLGLFRGAFFNTKAGYWGGLEHTFQNRKRRLLHEMLANRSIRYRIRDTDLPKVNCVRKFVKLSEEAKDWYEQATEDMYTAKRDPIKIKATFMRMRQLSSGFIGVPGDEDGKRAKIVFDQNPKLELLGSIVASIPLEYPVLIVHEFVWSGEQIEKELARLGIPSVSLRGSTKDPAKVRREFANGGRLIMNHKAGAFGLNLQNAAYILFYESPVSSIIRRQTEMRIRRRYSEWDTITQYDLLAMNTMDEVILNFHVKGRDLFKAILEGKFNA